MSSEPVVSNNSDSPVVESYLDSKSRIRITDLKEAKRKGEKWAMLTCYDPISAKIFDHARIPCLLVGDSAAQTVYGYKSALPVTVDELIPLVRAVSSSCERALVVAGLPFGSYEESPQAALRSATRFMEEAGAHAVKLKGGSGYCEHVKLLTQSGIPVMAHIGYRQKREHMLSGYEIQTREYEMFSGVVFNARCLEEAGAFACIVELVTKSVGRLVSDMRKIPIVGIGAGPCDAQVLIWQDMAGFCGPVVGNNNKSTGYLTDAAQYSDNKRAVNLNLSTPASGSNKAAPFVNNRVPKFVKKYANLGEMLYNAAVAYKEDVRSGAYPAPEHCYE